MRHRAALCSIALLGFCGGCGYIGPVVPPSPQIPMPVSDLAVIEMGDHLDVSFTPPTHTIDQFTIQHFSSFDLQVNGKSYPMPISMRPVHFTIPVSDWVNQDVSIDVRTAIKEKDHFSPPSNVVKMKVVPPLQAPVLAVTPTVQGYEFSWPSDGPGVQYDIYRKGPADNKFVQIATSDQPHYVDGSAQYGTPYAYQVQARTGSAMSLMSETKNVNAPDKFAPAQPKGLAAAATAEAIELSWERNTESDLKGYYIYRSSGDGKFTQVGNLTTLPAYSDRTVEHGKSYQYQVKAVDQVGNVSEASAVVSVMFP